MFGPVEGDLIVDFVGKNHEPVFLGELRDLLQDLTRVYGTGWVVGVNEDDRARAGSDEPANLCRIGDKTVFWMTGVVDSLAGMKRRGRGPERIIGAGNKDFIARLQQCRETEKNELRDPVSHENVVRRHIANPAGLLLHDHRFACRKNSLLITVRVRLPEVFDHRQAHGLRCPEPERSRVADVQFDDLIASLLQFAGAPGEGTADFVLYALETGTGGDAGRFHRWS